MASLGEKYLLEQGIEFSSHPYDYKKKGAVASAEALGIKVEQTVKTLVVDLGNRKFIFLLASGHVNVSMKNLARLLGVKTAGLASEKDAERLTGYQVGGMGPFGARTALKVYVDLAILDHDQIYINGGRRGLLVSMDSETLIEATDGEIVEVSTTK